MKLFKEIFSKEFNLKNKKTFMFAPKDLSFVGKRVSFGNFFIFVSNDEQLNNRQSLIFCSVWFWTIFFNIFANWNNFFSCDAEVNHDGVYSANSML